MLTDPENTQPVVTTSPSWLQVLARRSNARVALGRSGNGMPTKAQMAFALDHARARDAVHSSLDAPGIRAGLVALGLASIEAATTAPDRATYLTRPDLGRRLAPLSHDLLATQPKGAPLVIVAADGLSANATNLGAVPLIAALLGYLPAEYRQNLVTIVVPQCRVAAGDPICMALGAQAVVVLIGERPGLSASDSLGAYITFGPTATTSDADRNCVSNIRPGGLSTDEAAHRIAWLITAATRLKKSGVTLKDDSASSRNSQIATQPSSR